MPTLSLIVITKNEEEAIARCLKSVRFADQIIVVDSGSNDRTVEIARGCGAQVTSTADWPGYGPQKARALALAQSEWVLSLDADEWLEDEAAATIQQAIADPAAPAAFRMSRRSRFCGKIVSHSGWSVSEALSPFD